MTFSELRKKDVICVGDGKMLGRISDLEFDLVSGRICALAISCGGCGLFCHNEKSAIEIQWDQISCIGDDVILVSSCCCR